MASLLRVFLCHGKEDKQTVRELYARLQSDGFHPWLDEEDILPGQDWQLEIKSTIETSDVMIACFSSASINRDGYVQKEIRMGLDVAQLKREGSIFLIAARLSNCVVPSRLIDRQWVDLFEDSGYGKLVKSLMIRAHDLGRTVSPASSAISTQSPLLQQRKPIVPPAQPGDRKSLIASAKDLSAILSHCQAFNPDMSCGLLGGEVSGKDVQVKRVTNIKNVIAEADQHATRKMFEDAGWSPSSIPIDEQDLRRQAFLMDPRETASAYKEMKSRGLDIIGLYYSQHDPPRPSMLTLKMAKNNLWDMIYLIIEQDEDGTLINFMAWQIDKERQIVQPVDIRLDPP
ncbi:MAG: hypothetical protein OJF50_000555 [Nitrospira sp.]|jgi:proteasome lid subunit RPN8/RPN11|nr:hypothetical protein [Nitrospira sp.]